jgi:hypothetical protein
LSEVSILLRSILSLAIAGNGLQLNAGGEFSAQSSTNVQMMIEEKKFNSPTSAPLAF